MPERVGRVDHEAGCPRRTVGEFIHDVCIQQAAATIGSRKRLPVRELGRGRAARHPDLRVFAGRAGVHRPCRAGTRPALAYRRGPGRRAAGVPAGGRVLLQDRRAAGHRPGLDRADRRRVGRPARVLPPGPRRVRLSQHPGSDPAAPRGPPRRRPDSPDAGASDTTKSPRPVRRRDRLDRGRGAGPAAGRRRAVRGEQAGRPVRGDRGAGRGHRAAGGAGRAGDRPAAAALGRAGLSQRARAGDRDLVRDLGARRGARGPGRGRHVQRVVGVHPDAAVSGPPGEPPVLQERRLRGGVPRGAGGTPGVLLLAAGPDRVVGGPGVRGPAGVPRVVPELQQGVLHRPAPPPGSLVRPVRQVQLHRPDPGAVHARRGAAADLRPDRRAAGRSGAGRAAPGPAGRGRQAVRVRRRGQRMPGRGPAGRAAGRPRRRRAAPGTGRRGRQLARRAVGRGCRRDAGASRRELHPGRVPMTDPRPKLSWSDLRGARAGVWGLGREGHANVRKLRALGVEPVLVDDHPGDPDVLATSEGGLAALERCDVVVKTPGLSRYRPEVARLNELGIPVPGGLGLWLAEQDLRRVLCVTGTKGKSTTASLTGHLLTALGYRCLVGGNIGVVPYDPAEQTDFDYWVIEVSSYQATALPCTPPVTAVTSLHPDHLDWHGGVEQYYRDKLSMCTQPGADLTVANGDSDLLRQHETLLGPRVEWVSENDDPDADWMAPFGLLGRHNRRNALIARRCLAALGVPEAADTADDADDAADGALRAAAAGYRPLPSRLTPIRTIA